MVLKPKIYLLDASIIPVCLDIIDWATYRTSKDAVKLHAVSDYDGCLPVFAQIIQGDVHNHFTVLRVIINNYYSSIIVTSFEMVEILEHCLMRLKENITT